MKAVFLIFPLGLMGYAQVKLSPCGPAPTTAANPGLTGPTAPVPRIVAAKPEKPPVKVPPVLPQIQYRQTPVSPSTGCWCGTVGASLLTSATVSQEVPIIYGLSAKFRLEHVLIHETRQFTSDLVDRLTVTVRPKAGDDFISEFELKSADAQNFAYEQPAPPVLTGAYDVVLKFTGSSPLAIDGVSNFSSGSLRWEMCGYHVP
jgi:hypothetical protein